MKYEDYDPLSKKVAITMSEKDLESLEVFLDFADAFLKKMDDEKLWPERDRILKMANELNEINAKLSAEKKEYEDYAKANR